MSNTVSRFYNLNCEEREVLLAALANHIIVPEYGMNPKNTYHDTLHKMFLEIPSPTGDTLLDKIEHYLGSHEVAFQYVCDMHADKLQE